MNNSESANRDTNSSSITKKLPIYNPQLETKNAGNQY